MPAQRQRPSPPARMVALLAVEKRRILAERGEVTHRDFEEAWDRCWKIMVAESAWAHFTPSRRGWRGIMVDTIEGARDAFLDRRSTFSFAVDRLTSGAADLGRELVPEEVPRALIAAIAYVESSETDAYA